MTNLFGIFLIQSFGARYVDKPVALWLGNVAQHAELAFCKTVAYCNIVKTCGILYPGAKYHFCFLFKKCVAPQPWQI
jgi:hypothetical protein